MSYRKSYTFQPNNLRENEMRVLQNYVCLLFLILVTQKDSVNPTYENLKSGSLINKLVKQNGVKGAPQQPAKKDIKTTLSGMAFILLVVLCLKMILLTLANTEVCPFI